MLRDDELSYGNVRRGGDRYLFTVLFQTYFFGAFSSFFFCAFFGIFAAEIEHVCVAMSAGPDLQAH
jgi:hypothetical protein